MLTSNDEKIRFIHEYFSKHIKNKEKFKYVEDIPFMIRNNGLFNTLMYLRDKGKEESIFVMFSNYYEIISQSDNLLIDIFNMHKELNRDYLIYTHEFYEFACQLKIYFRTI
ncbi:type III-B CRISPR module-associated protein Cmr5 [Paramaledivibacter caminithermalis]|jgi:CRISPR type III-B/RAMP module-associated protein Cmr5|uniref:CRISPR type III-B/RAMP module-associated protein Cmr5 n=1 Tax=Paramaledivibacter caminithermalis (strain DSM 15212 / CIP 107654 / DViRD3) TaxID=1121301 RepID=A0A1M6QSY8_PARC5|nr:type III-B CRISPR module-associated protein Cmr5 [Paramaledivibacter caminithermalis]SHK23334.1 CRISPR type III-B/RAMP module-associated protein Cmr5 [Paramaledivibacter caminithermalis DSM 15212]